MSLRRLTPVIVWSAACLAAAARAEVLHDPASPLVVDEWLKGAPVTLTEGLGKNTFVVFFFYTWCPHCRQAIPILSELQQRYRDLGVTFIGISNEKSAKISAFLAKPEWADKTDFSVAHDLTTNDPIGETNKLYMGVYGDPGVPYAFLIDRTGTIIWRGHPLAGLERRIRKLYPVAASRPMSKMPPPVSIGSSGRPHPQNASTNGPPQPTQITASAPSIDTSGILAEQAIRIPVSEKWKSRLNPAYGTTQWLAVHTSFPIATITTAGGPTGSTWQTVTWSARDWSLASVNGWRISAAGYGNENEFSGMSDCSGVVTREALPRVMATNVIPWAGIGAPTTPISLAGASQPADSKAPMPLGPLVDGKVRCWIYFPLSSVQARLADANYSLSYRNSAPLQILSAAASAPSQ